jgi:hypothetical protein
LVVVLQPGSRLVVLATRIDSAEAAVDVGRIGSMSATIPATCGLAMLVPPRK